MAALPILIVQNKNQRMVFAEWAQNNEVSFNNVWFSDEAHLDGVVNKQNVRFWASEHPRVIHEKVHHASRITVWVAISSHGLLGPIFFEETVNTERYLSMLRNTFVPQLLATGLPLQIQWFIRMEPGRTQRMLFWTFCMAISTRVLPQTDFLIVSHVDRTDH
jgi:hypothetical protein